MKIAIIGYSGAGKSTLAAKLGEIYSIPVLHLDTVQFCPGWEERPLEDSREIVYGFMQSPDWVIDGNYGNFFQKKRLEDADKIIFLNFPRRTCLYSVIKRYIKYRGSSRPDMADGCCEKIDREFLHWILIEGRTKARRDKFKRICREFFEKTLIFTNRRQVNAFINASKTK